MIVQKLQILIDAQDRSTKKIKNIKRAIIGMSAAITAASALSVKAYMAQERAEARLEHLTKQISDATDEQIDSLKNQAKALQQVGVVGDEVAMVGQSQLATFALNTDQINKLTPALLDMAVALKGANVTQEDMLTTANAIGRAIDGGAGALTRYGISLTDTQKKLFSTANRMERVSMLSEILEGNYGGLNEAMRDTAEGGLKALRNNIGDLSEKLGEAIAIAGKPLLSRLVEMSTTMNESGKEVNQLSLSFLGLSKFTYDVINGMRVIALQVEKASIKFNMFWTSLGGLLGKDPVFVKRLEEINDSLLKIGTNAQDFSEEIRFLREQVLDGTDAEFKGLGIIGSDAMEAIEKATERTKDEINETKSLINSLENDLQNIIDIEKERFEQEKDYGTSIAEAYVEQENKIKDIRDRLSKETDNEESDRLAKELTREQEALNKRSHLLKLYYSQIQEERRSAGLTEFGREVESIEAGQRAFETGQTTQLKEIAHTYNFDFSGSNISDKEKLTSDIIEAINRASELNQISGE